jgi:FkbM family methyltransferase
MPEPGAADAVRYLPVSVAGAPTVEICIDPAAGDLVARWFMDHDWIDEPVQRAFLTLVTPGCRVLDLGCHLGTFSLAASALGAEVVAVDAAPEHVRLLSLAAERNGFDRLQVFQAVAAGPGLATEAPRTARFVVRSIHGHVQTAGEPEEGTIEVDALPVSELLERAGWDSVDIVKMDIEGSEVAALQGMRPLFDRGLRPAMVLESNWSMLEHMGRSVGDLRALLFSLGYEVLLIDHLRPGVLVELEPQSIQTESASDVMAVASRSGRLSRSWRIEGPLTAEHTVVRLLTAAASPAPGYRKVANEILRCGPTWLSEFGAVRAAAAALDHDQDRDVTRIPAGRCAARDDVDAPAPSRNGLPERVVIWAECATAGWPEADLRPPFDLVGTRPDFMLTELSFYVDRGERLAVLAPNVDQGELFLSLLAGRAELFDGDLSVQGRVTGLIDLMSGVEPALSVRDNALVLGAYLGGHVPTLERRLDGILEGAGLSAHRDQALRDAGTGAIARLGVALTLCAPPADVLLLGLLPRVDADLAAWARGRPIDGGSAIIQLVQDESQLVIDPDRVLWLEHSRVRACGHPASVFEEARLASMGASGWRTA